MINIAVFISGNGSNLQALIDAEKAREFDGAAKIALVLSSNKAAFGLSRAAQNGIKTAVFEKKDFYSLEEMDGKIAALLAKNKIDFIVLAGYLNIVTGGLLKEYKNKIINIHPSLIPAFCGKGLYGIKVHRAVVDYGAKVTGATVHFVDGGADTGAIILQQSIPVDDGDDAEVLQRRVLELEHKLLKEAVKLYCQKKIIIKGRKVLCQRER
jgi:phosphoribosylglycinamide formyltransferase-1